MKNLLKKLKAYANSNAASKLYVCATPQNTTLVVGDYAALTWVEITGVGSRGETGKKTNILTYDTWGDSVILKAKGLTDAGSPEVEVARIPSDPGQVILRAAGAIGNNNNYAFKELRSDGVVGGVGTTLYNRGLVVGPSRPGGRNEDFDLEVYSFALQQEEIVVDPTAGGVAPVNTVVPTITGTASVGQTLTSTTGTFTGDATITYVRQWFAGGVAIPGANGTTFVLTSTQTGKIITVRITATNASGFAQAFSAPTSAVS